MLRVYEELLDEDNWLRLAAAFTVSFVEGTSVAVASVADVWFWAEVKDGVGLSASSVGLYCNSGVGVAVAGGSVSDMWETHRISQMFPKHGETISPTDAGWLHDW